MSWFPIKLVSSVPQTPGSSGSPTRQLLWGQGAATFGTQIMLVALPLVAALTLKATPLQMGLLATAQTIPWLLVTLFAGLMIDNGSPRRILWWSNVARGTLILLIPLAYLLNFLSYPLLLVIALLYGVLNVFYDLALQTFVPSVVAKDQLVGANGQLESSRQVASIAGPGIGGALIHAITAPFTLLLGALVFFLSAFSIGRIAAQQETAVKSRRFDWREIREGWQAVFGSNVLRPLVLAAATYNFSAGIYMGVAILFMTRELSVSAAGVGVVLAIQSVGGVLGALFVKNITAQYGLGGTIWRMYLVAALGACIAPLTLSSGSLAVVLVGGGSFLSSVAIVVSSVNAVSLRQSVTPPQLLGRVNATARFVSFGVGSLGGIVGGLAAEQFGLRGAMFVIAGVALLACLWVYFSPLRILRAWPPPEVKQPTTFDHQ
ncbi:MAG: MFS transporter [Meiothermus sp.]|nr:MFS transporter [Meiothermus sp.]